MARAVEWVYTKPCGALQEGFRVSRRLTCEAGDIPAACRLAAGREEAGASAEMAVRSRMAATFDKFYRSNAKFPDIALDPLGGRV